MKAYHCLCHDMRSGEGSEPPWEIGEERAYPGAIKLCESGYHASPTLWDALQYAPGPVACLVEVSEPVEQDETKSVHRRRQLLKAMNLERELRLFAADCAERALYIFELKHPNDKRPREAIQAARDFANGKISREQLTVVWDAAWDAAWTTTADAAAAAAGAAAGNALNAARDAARTALTAIATATTESDAWKSHAGPAVARAMAVAVAMEAESKWQRERFDQLCGGIFDES